MALKKILHVDDDQDIRTITQMSLEMVGGFELQQCASGKEALIVAPQFQPDLLLLDVMMPEMDGYEVCRRIKAEPRLQDIPIIFVTAKVDVDSISQGFQAGAVDYLCKPFHAEELLARVNTHLTLYRAKKLLQQNNLSLQQKYELNQQ